MPMVIPSRTAWGWSTLPNENILDQPGGSGLDEAAVQALIDASLADLASDAELAAAIAGVSSVGPGDRFTTGKWYGPAWTSSIATASNSNFNQNRLFAAQFYVGRTQSFDRLGFWLQTAVASSGIRVGVYADTGNGEPGALVYGSGTISTASGGGSWLTDTIDLDLEPDLYYLAMVCQGGVSSPGVGRAITTNLPPIGIPQPNSDGGQQSTTNCFYRDSVSGALPDPFGAASLQFGSVAGLYVPFIRAAA